MNFAYSFESAVVWDPVNHEYVPSVDGGSVGTWIYTNGTDTTDDDVTGSANGATLNDAIVVRNHSNASVDVVAGFVENGVTQPSKTNNGAVATVSKEAVKQEIITAEQTAVDNPPKCAYDVTVSGKPNTDQGFTLGTITVTISKHVDQNGNG